MASVTLKVVKNATVILAGLTALLGCEDNVARKESFDNHQSTLAELTAAYCKDSPTIITRKLRPDEPVLLEAGTHSGNNIFTLDVVDFLLLGVPRVRTDTHPWEPGKVGKDWIMTHSPSKVTIETVEPIPTAGLAYLMETKPLPELYPGYFYVRSYLADSDGTVVFEHKWIWQKPGGKGGRIAISCEFPREPVYQQQMGKRLAEQIASMYTNKAYNPSHTHVRQRKEFESTTTTQLNSRVLIFENEPIVEQIRNNRAANPSGKVVLNNCPANLKPVFFSKYLDKNIKGYLRGDYFVQPVGPLIGCNDQFAFFGSAHVYNNEKKYYYLFEGAFIGRAGAR